MRAHYLPGTHPACIGARALVITSPERTAELAAVAGGDVTVLGVIDALSRGVLTDLPPFAIVLIEDADVRIVLRGAYEVTVDEHTWSGSGVATWTEHLVTGAAGSEVAVASSDRPAGGTELPVAAGVVLAAALRWRGVPFDQVAVPAQEPSSAPAEPVVAEPAVALVASPPPHDPHHTVYEVEEVDEDFDAKHGATVAGRRPDKAVTPAPLPAGPLQASTQQGDHDGHTVAASELRRIKRQAPVAGALTSRRASLHLSTGRTVEVAQPVLIGRAPRAGQSSGHDIPSLVVVEDPYVSGTHLEVRFQDSSLVAIDRSTNGTLLTRPGRAPERLTKDLPTVLTGGSVLALSEDLTVGVELQDGP